jgi:hypothetical protein
VLVVNFVNHADVGVIQRRGGLRFTLETAKGLRVLCNLIGQELQGHEAVEFHILSLVDHTHAPATELLNDAVMGNDLANHGRNVGVILGRPTSSVNESDRETCDDYCSLAYSDLAAMRMGMSGSASFQSVRKSL